MDKKSGLYRKPAKNPRPVREGMERPMGLEPTPGPWQGPVLPLYYGRPKHQNSSTRGLLRQGPIGGHLHSWKSPADSDRIASGPSLTESNSKPRIVGGGGHPRVRAKEKIKK